MLSSRPKTTAYSLLSVWVIAARWRVIVEGPTTVVVLHPVACEHCGPKVLASTAWPPPRR